MRRIPVRGVVMALGLTIELPDEAAHYVRDVLRLEVGTVVEVFDGEGAAFHGPIEALEPLVVRLLDRVDASALESPCRVTLYQAIPKKDRFEWLLEKAAELGVHRIVPVQTVRSVVKIPDERREDRQQRWQRICDAAARQCGRAQSPTVSPIVALADVPDAGHLRVVLDPMATVALTETIGDIAEVDVFIGPEGWFSPEELEWLGSRTTACRLGPRVLRSETAGIAALTVIQAVTGGLD